MQRTRVLVAEDNDIIRGGIRELLARAPEFELVGEAQDGRQAIELTSKLQPDIVLLDLRMPDVDGASAARQITSSRPASKIIVVTADDSAHAERLARSATSSPAKPRWPNPLRRNSPTNSPAPRQTGKKRARRVTPNTAGIAFLVTPILR